MILVRGRAGGTELSGTIYEPDDDAPTFRGAPDEGAPYTWLCDEFYEVDSGGSAQMVGDQTIRIAFESPLPRGFDDRKQAIEAAKEHVRTQFARIGIQDVDIAVLPAGEEDGDHTPLRDG